MRIEELHLKNFRCFKELDITFPKDPKIDPKGSNLAVFIGLNGAGKTAILDAISLLLSMTYKGWIIKTKSLTVFSDNDITINTEKVIGEIKFNGLLYQVYKDKNIPLSEIRYVDFDNNYDELSLKSLDASNFTILQYTATRKKVANLGYNNFNEETDSFDDFKNWFIEEDAKEGRLIREKKDFNITNPKLDIIRKAIERFCSSISNMKVSSLRTKDIGDTNIVVDWDKLTLSLEQLSEGQRNLLLLVSDISFSLLNVQEIRNSFFSDNPDTVLQREGIVLIDEIELHLHPQWQREVLPALQKTFPNIQFIVTTHSPQVLSNLKKEEVFILKDNKIVEVTPHIEGRDSNSILSELFGVDERPERFKNQLKQLYNAIDDENLSEAKKILAELTVAFGEQDTEIVRANLHLSFAEE
jgi:predicted ATP-binding protein involved in virulence